MMGRLREKQRELQILDLKRGDVIECLLSEAVGSVQGGDKRSMIVVSNNLANKYSPVLICVPMTSQKKKDIPTHFKITTDKYKDMRYDSTILCEQIITVDKSQVVGDVPFFKLDTEDVKKLDNCLRISLSLVG